MARLCGFTILAMMCVTWTYGTFAQRSCPSDDHAGNASSLSQLAGELKEIESAVKGKQPRGMSTYRLPFSGVEIDPSIFEGFRDLTENQMINLIRKNLDVKVLIMPDVPEGHERNPYLFGNKSEDLAAVNYFSRRKILAIDSAQDYWTDYSLNYIEQRLEAPRMAEGLYIAPFSLLPSDGNPPLPYYDKDVIVLSPAADRAVIVHELAHKLYHDLRYPNYPKISGKPVNPLWAQFMELDRLEAVSEEKRVAWEASKAKAADLNEAKQKGKAYVESMLDYGMLRFDFEKEAVIDELGATRLEYDLRDHLGFSEDQFLFALSYHFEKLMELNDLVDRVELDETFQMLRQSRASLDGKVAQKFNQLQQTLRDTSVALAYDYQWLLNELVTHDSASAGDALKKLIEAGRVSQEEGGRATIAPGSGVELIVERGGKKSELKIEP